MESKIARELWLASLLIAQQRIETLEAEVSEQIRKRKDTYKVLGQLEAARGEHKGLLDERDLY